MGQSNKQATDSVALGEAFALFQVEESSAPGDGIPGTWFRYTITQGPNTITGHRQGTRSSVTLALDEIVVALNERRVGRRGRVHLTPGRGAAGRPSR
jgi:hypothetical protein